MKTFVSRALCITALIVVGFTARSQENQRSALQVATDRDGDVAVVMDTESIRMMLLPEYQSCISSFIFKPTGNDILSRMSIKMTQAGHGLLQDNFWEQDWRYSEFRHKWYDFNIVSQGPDELAVKFWTTSEGWLQAVDSGVVSDLLSNIKIERTVRMPAGKPYFLCDVKLSIDPEKETEFNSKLPQFWMHNMSLFTDDLSDEFQRPHVLGIAEQTPGGGTVSGDYVYSENIAEGWSAHTAPRTKEGIVYLMDPSYVQCLYNCGNTTLEWFGDNMLITRDHPLRTRIYILPVIGLDKVHFADPHMIVRLHPRVVTEGAGQGTLELGFSVSPSYRQVRKISFDTRVTYGLHERQHQQVTFQGDLPVVRNLRVESPRHARAVFQRPDGVPFTPQTPVLFDITARIERVSSDGRIQNSNVKFQHFHLGAYPTHKNAHLQGGEPLAELDRVDAYPWIPTPDPDLEVTRDQFKVFTLMGPHGRHFRIPDAIGRAQAHDGTPIVWDEERDVGFSVGFPTAQNGLTTFPLDFERLFGYSVLINCNTQTDLVRLVGQSILAGYLQRGGGYVCFGGESAYTTEAPKGNLLNAFNPIVPKPRSIYLSEEAETGQLIVLKPEHPIFTGNGKTAQKIDVQNLPETLSWHELELKTPTEKPLIRDPRQPFSLNISDLEQTWREALGKLGKDRLVSRAERTRQLFAAMAPDVQGHVIATCRKVFDGNQMPLQNGVPIEAVKKACRDKHKIDIRAAFIDFGDDDKEQLNMWLDVAFADPNAVNVGALSDDLRTAVVDVLQRAITSSDSILIQDGDEIQLPASFHKELTTQLMTERHELPRSAKVDVLMAVDTPRGRFPFLVELSASDPKTSGTSGRTICFLNSPFGDRTQYPGSTVPYWEWPQWEQLVANAIMYAGQAL